MGCWKMVFLVTLLLVAAKDGRRSPLSLISPWLKHPRVASYPKSFGSSVGVQIAGNNDEVGLWSCVQDKLKAVVEFILGCIQACLCCHVGREDVRRDHSINCEDGKAF